MIKFNRNKDYKMALKRFIDIGFEIVRDEVNDWNQPIREYWYKPSYLNDSRYTLVLFNEDDFRLYIHKNKKGSVGDVIFQISLYQANQINYINDGFNKEFYREINKIERDNKIDEILR